MIFVESEDGRTPFSHARITASLLRRGFDAPLAEKIGSLVERELAAHGSDSVRIEEIAAWIGKAIIAISSAVPHDSPSHGSEGPVKQLASILGEAYRTAGLLIAADPSPTGLRRGASRLKEADHAISGIRQRMRADGRIVIELAPYVKFLQDLATSLEKERPNQISGAIVGLLSRLPKRDQLKENATEEGLVSLASAIQLFKFNLARFGLHFAAIPEARGCSVLLNEPPGLLDALRLFGRIPGGSFAPMLADVGLSFAAIGQVMTELVRLGLSHVFLAINCPSNCTKDARRNCRLTGVEIYPANVVPTDTEHFVGRIHELEILHAIVDIAEGAHGGADPGAGSGTATIGAAGELVKKLRENFIQNMSNASGLRIRVTVAYELCQESCCWVFFKQTNWVKSMTIAEVSPPSAFADAQGRGIWNPTTFDFGNAAFTAAFAQAINEAVKGACK